MRYVYILQSIDNPDRFYTGLTDDLKKRLDDHNRGKSIHTNKFRPWKIKTYVAFDDPQKAEDFEKFLKSGNGRVFSDKRL